uniref:Uncharacterized protein n=1 Tax=Picea sitchensis TaxID=3332 RepID=A0A6B9XUB8_PICSI|nr:hypothetical protein Q903MT_gene5739 [Picea sitchensis]
MGNSTGGVFYLLIQTQNKLLKDGKLADMRCHRGGAHMCRTLCARLELSCATFPGLME